MTFLFPPQVRSVSLETKQICAKALLNLVAEDTLPSLIEVRRGNSGLGAGSHIVQVKCVVFLRDCHVLAGACLESM